MPQHPMNYQDQGAMASLKSANEAMNAARNATPVEMRHKFDAVIQFHSPWYEWYWQLRGGAHG